MQDNDWKQRLGMVYSTNPDFQFEVSQKEEPATLPKHEQRLRVRVERKGRNGKIVTLVTGFMGTDNDLKALGKYIKTHLSTGGTAKDGEIVIQGEVRSKIVQLLLNAGYSNTK